MDPYVTFRMLLEAIYDHEPDEARSFLADLGLWDSKSGFPLDPPRLHEEISRFLEWMG